ncbi:MAG: diaminopimelate dehydrogenase [Rickettsiales bacterium]|nr:diaminopimelate dehydrogenase [Rickettsiales bacterium]
MANIAIAGLGNIGNAIITTYDVQRSQNTDIIITGVIRRKLPHNGKKMTLPYNDIEAVTDVNNLTTKPQVILCAAPSGVVKQDAIKYLNAGYCTVDCFDDHTKIYEQKMELDAIAKKNKAVSIIATGWDPGFDSALRALYAQLSPTGTTFTTFGPGRSMGHTTTAKAIPGVIDAVSLTLPGEKPGTHKRELYLVAPPAMHAEIEAQVQAHPYFVKTETQETFVKFVDDVSPFDTSDHGGWLYNKGAGLNVHVETKLHGNNPIMTANMMFAAARAAAAAQDAGQYGCFTVIERPLIDFIPGFTIQEKLARIRY